MTWSPGYQGETAGIALTFDFMGAQPGQWRVMALDNTGHNWRSDPSALRKFTYTV